MNNITVDVSGAINFNLNNGLSIEETDPIYVNVKGDIMHGNLNMNNNIIQNIGIPKDDLDVSNKKYVDDVFSPLYVKYQLIKKTIDDTSKDLTDKFNNIKNYVNETLSLRIDKVEQSINKLSSNKNEIIIKCKIFQFPKEIEDYKKFLLQQNILVLTEYLQTKRVNINKYERTRYAKQIKPWKKLTTLFLDTITKDPDFFPKEGNKIGTLLVNYIESWDLDKPGHYDIV